MKPRVDVVVPCYNYAEYLRVCIDSILSQADVDVRVLVLDDCSSDDSPQIGEALARADSRVTFRRHQQNHGHIATYNEGIDWVEAPYWLLISADDLLTPGALARATAVMENDPGVGMVYGRQIAFAHEPHLPADHACPGNSKVPGHKFIESVCASGENPVATPTVVARTAIQRTVGGYEAALPHTADLEMWLRFASFAAVAEVRAFQAFKRGHERNMQHSYVRRGAGDIVERREAFMRFLSRQECPIAERAALCRAANEAVAASAFWRGAHLFDEGLSEDAGQLFDLALQFDPALSSRREWTRMRVKRWLGTRVWRSIARTTGAVSRIRHSVDAGKHPVTNDTFSRGPGAYPPQLNGPSNPPMAPSRSSRARVLFVANAGKIGGGARVLMDLMLNLDSDQYRPVLVAPEEGQITDWAINMGVQHHISAAGDWQAAPALARRSMSLLRIMIQERVAIVHTAAPTCYRAAGLAARLAGAARVCHLGFPPQPGELQHSFLSPPDAVIGCYEGQARDHIDEIHQIRSDCHVVGICNGIDTKRFNADKPNLAVRRGSPQVVAILGHISAVKGHPEFVEAAALLSREFPAARFVVIGAETLQHGLQTTLEDRLKHLGLQGQFDFLGFRDDVPALLSAVDVVALPSHAEGLPLAALEAMACGKPIVATPVGGVSEAVVDGLTGRLVAPRNHHALAAAIGQFLREPDLAARMGVAARERIQQRFSVETFADAVQDVYRKVSGLSRRAVA